MIHTLSSSSTTSDSIIDNGQTCNICRCEFEFGAIVDCSSLNLSQLPDNIPVDTVSLDLHNNHLVDIDDAVFVHLSALLKLKIQDNSIRTQFKLPSSLVSLIANDNKLVDMYGMFDTSEFLWTIDLRRNNINSIRNGTFATCRNLKKLVLSSNPITRLVAGSFTGLTTIQTLDLHDTNLTSLDGSYFHGLPGFINKVDIGSKNLKHVAKGTFRFTFVEFYISESRIEYFPGGVFALPELLSELSSMHFGKDRIKKISPRAFEGIPRIYYLVLSSNELTRLPTALFVNTSISSVLDVSNNLLEELPDCFLKSSPNLTILVLYRNRLIRLTAKTFEGLQSLQILYLFHNRIAEIPPMAFYGTSLTKLFLFSNNITSLGNTSLAMKNRRLTLLHVYYNNIANIEDNAFDWVSDGAKVYLSAEHLYKWPKYAIDIDIFAIGDINIKNIALHVGNNIISEGMKHAGFDCHKDGEQYTCMPCIPGTYGDLSESGCVTCPAGGFYQNRSGQISGGIGEVGCIQCNLGTFVSQVHAPGTSPIDCDVCPSGTNKTEPAGFRACPCLNGYFRKDRFGLCEPCPIEGINCSSEYQTLLPGYWWTWSFYRNESQLQLSRYQEFVANIVISNDSYSKTSIRFEGKLPKPFPCQRGTLSCPGKPDNVNGYCAEGYEGWLCSECSLGFYSWFEYCVKCPFGWHLVIELCLAIFIVCSVIILTVWDIRRRDIASRSLVDILIARFKIVLGYYQITGAMFTSLHNIHWPQQISTLAYIFKVLELNIFKLLAKPRCYTDKLELNVYDEFIIAVSFCCLVLVIPRIIYAIRICHLHVKYRHVTSLSRETLIQLKKDMLRSKCVFVTVLLLFITYLSMCDVILSLMPASCQTFCTDELENVCVERLRSDYSIDCNIPNHKDYTKAAYTALIYVVGYPLCLLVLIYKNVTKNESSSIRPINDGNEDRSQPIGENDAAPHTDFVPPGDRAPGYAHDGGLGFFPLIVNSIQRDNESVCTEESFIMDDEVVVMQRSNTQELSAQTDDGVSTSSDNSAHMSEVDPHENQPKNPSSYPLHIRFLCENYKPAFWYWEIVELSRKVLQTLLVVLYGSDDPLTLGATIALSMMFITLHAYFKPMKDDFEHGLQLLSLVAVFLNLLSAVILLVPYADTSGHRHMAMAVFIIGINASVVVIAIGNAVSVFWRSVRQHGCRSELSCKSCFEGVGNIIAKLADVTHNHQIQ